MIFGKMIDKVRRNHCRSRPTTLQAIRECVLFNLMLFAVFGGMIAYIPGVLSAVFTGLYDIALIDTLYYGWVIYLFFAPNRSYRFRAFGLLIPIWGLSLYLIVRVGTEGAGFLWLFVVPILTGTLIGRKEGIIGIVLGAAALVLIAASSTVVPDAGNTAAAAYGTSFWSITVGNIVLLMTLVLVSTSVMIEALDRAIRRLEAKLRELSETKDATIEAFATLAEYRDAETGYHIRRTKAFVELIVRALKKRGFYPERLDEEFIGLLVKSAPLHDIGKIGVPDAILLKKGRLTPEEMKEMQKHTVYGYEALTHTAARLGNEHFLSMAAEIAYTHQERWDGRGYPRGLAGEEIPLSGRIMAVADVYDALRSRRSYKEPKSHEEAMAFLKEHAGTDFDPKIIEVLPDIEERMRELYDRFADDFPKER